MKSSMIGEEDHVNIIYNLIQHYDSNNGCDFHDLMDYGIKGWHTIYTHEDDIEIMWR